MNAIKDYKIRVPKAMSINWIGFYTLYKKEILRYEMGASFLFIRIAVPTLGPAFLMNGRVLFAALFLLLVALLLKKRLLFIKNMKISIKVLIAGLMRYRPLCLESNFPI